MRNVCILLAFLGLTTGLAEEPRTTELPGFVYASSRAQLVETLLQEPEIEMLVEALVRQRLASMRQNSPLTQPPTVVHHTTHLRHQIVFRERDDDGWPIIANCMPLVLISLFIITFQTIFVISEIIKRMSDQ